jgi:ABC-type transport system substrate-binding protein
MTSVVLVILATQNFFASLHAAENNSTLSGKLAVQFSTEPTQIDPLLLEDLTGLRISANTIGTPFEYDGSGKLIPSLAGKLTANSKHTEFTLQFKEKLMWSDGVPFQTKDFMRALERMVNEPIRAALSELTPKIDLQHSKILDEKRVLIVLKNPEPQFEHWLTTPGFAPIRTDMIKTYTKKHSAIVPTLAAYAITDYKREDHLMLTKNKFYFAAAKVEIPEVVIHYVKDEASLLPLMKRGMIDILTRVPVLELDEIQKVSQITNVPVQAITYLGLNTKKQPFSDLNYRIQFAEDVWGGEESLTQVLKTGELPAHHFAPELIFSEASKKSPVSTKNESPISFKLQSDLGSRNQTILEFLQNRVKQKNNWKMELDLMEFKTHYAKLKSDPDQAYRFGWQNPVDLPYVLYQVLSSSSPNNFTGWKNQKYDELLEKLRAEAPHSKKAAKIEGDLENILREEAPVIPLLQQVLRFSSSKRVLGFRANPFGVILFRELRLTKDNQKINN